ncbi:hypothetical protein MP228_003386 [Amoeboaphelidium protococcarum]|nr:hypothetical protein MP228_003386 [Amoeboaphelidium protococcarum]
MVKAFISTFLIITCLYIQDVQSLRVQLDGSVAVAKQSEGFLDSLFGISYSVRSWQITNLVPDTSLTLEGSPYFEIQLQTNYPLVVKYLTVYTQAQYQNVLNNINSRSAFIEPSIKRYELPTGDGPLLVNFTLNAQNKLPSYYYLILWTPSPEFPVENPDYSYQAPNFNIPVTFSGSLRVINGNGLGEMTSDDNNYSKQFPYLVAIWSIILTIVFTVFKFHRLLQSPIPVFLFAALFCILCSNVLQLAYFTVIRSNGLYRVYRPLTSAAYAFSCICDGLIFLLTATIATGWSIFITAVPLREQVVFSVLIFIYCLLGCVRDSSGTVDGQAFIQLAIEFMRICISFVLNIILTASVLRWKTVFMLEGKQSNVSFAFQFKDGQEYLIDQQTSSQRGSSVSKLALFNTLNSVRKLNYIQLMASIVPPFLFLPTVLIFLQSYLLFSIDFWVSNVTYNVIAMVWYLYMTWCLINRPVDLSERMKGVESTTKTNPAIITFKGTLLLDNIKWYNPNSEGVSFWNGIFGAIDSWLRGIRAQD